MRILRNTLLTLVALAVVALIAFWVIVPSMIERSRNTVGDGGPYPVSDAAATLHAKRGTRGQVDIPRLLEGNVALQVFTAVTKSPSGQNYDENPADAFDNITPLAIGQRWPIAAWTSLLARAQHQADKLHEVEKASNGRFKIIKSRADLEALLEARANGEQITGGLLGIEGAHPLEGDIANLDRIEEAGYRLVALQHFFDNALGGSLHGTSNQGLTEFGRQVVKEVVARGLILDIAHSSPQVAEDVTAITDIPLIVSHTGVQAHCDVKRNYPDALMKKIAAAGGVIGMGYWDEVTCGDSTPAGIAQMIKTAVTLLGEDHVALGSDFDGSVATEFDTSELSALTHALIEVGLTETQIRKVMGDNMIRVMRARLR
jgi:membrane dipeptidase